MQIIVLLSITLFNICNSCYGIYLLNFDTYVLNSTDSSAESTISYTEDELRARAIEEQEQEPDKYNALIRGEDQEPEEDNTLIRAEEQEQEQENARLWAEEPGEWNGSEFSSPESDFCERLLWEEDHAVQSEEWIAKLESITLEAYDTGVTNVLQTAFPEAKAALEAEYDRKYQLICFG